MTLRMRLERLWLHRRVLGTLVRRDLRVRYARSVLGYLWTLIDPLAMAMVYFFVFGVLFKRQGAPEDMPFIVFLVCAMLPWNWFNASINESARALYSERLLVRSTNIPREMWVIRVVLAKGIEFLLSLPILAGFVIVYLFLGDIEVNAVGFLWIIPALLIQLILSIGMGLVMAPITTLADDFVRLVRIALRILFYFTPIVYSLTLVEERAPWATNILMFNPMVAVSEMWRMGLTSVGTVIPMWQLTLAAFGVAIAWLFAGMWVFNKLEPAVLKEI